MRLSRSTSLRSTARDPIARDRAKKYSKKKALREMSPRKTLESRGRLNFSSDRPCAFRIRYDPSIKAIDFDAIEGPQPILRSTPITSQQILNYYNLMWTGKF